jgi:FlaA1/EpsC-like NDP-sugar epimerase
MSPAPDRLRESVLRFRRILSIFGQLLLVVISNRMAFWLRFDGALPDWALSAFWQALPWLVVIRAVSFVPFRLYEGLWRYTSIYDLQALLGGIGLSSFVFFIYTHTPLGPDAYPRSIFVTDAVLLTMMLGGIRMTRRILAEYGREPSGKRVLVYGAGDAGELIVRDMKGNPTAGYQPLGFIDDAHEKVGRRIHGVPVLGTRHDLPDILRRVKPDEVLIAIPAANARAVRSIVRWLEPYKVPIKTLPNLRDIIDGKVEVAQIRGLSVEDLLARAPVGLDPLPVKRLIEGRRVMVTGAGGSIGSELCRQIATLTPASLVMFERYENSLHAIEMELRDRRFTFGLYPTVGDVTDSRRVDDVLAQYQPEIIFHAAAHKHVPLMEHNPCEAIKNNVRGTRTLAAAAELHAVDRFIFISTDKAVNPTNVMGASKRVCELVVQAQANGSGTAFSTVRFGNVLGSNGSVVPRFLEQIKRGGPVTVTHPEMKRFFMLIPEAVQLVLHAAAHAESGSTYVLEMGDQVKLVDMARDLIRLSGFSADDDIPIVFTGLRPGEKLSEELVGPDEDVELAGTSEILCVRSRTSPPDTFMRDVERLELDAEQGRADAVRRHLTTLVGFHAPSVLPGLAVPPEKTEHESGMAVDAPSAIASLDATDEQACPKCRTGRARRSRTRTLHERAYKSLTLKRPYRCGACGWRGWLVPLEFGDRLAVNTARTVDLSTLDDVAAPTASPARPAFSPRNLS